MAMVVDAAPYRQLIAKQHQSQVTIEARTGVSQSTISEIQSGRLPTIRMSTAMSLLRGLEGTIVLPGAGGGAL